MIRRPPRSTLFPSTPLFRSQVERDRQAEAAVTGGTDPHPRGDGRVGGVEVTTARHRQEGGLKAGGVPDRDRESTRLNSSHSQISYAVFCLEKKKTHELVPMR